MFSASLCIEPFPIQKIAIYSSPPLVFLRKGQVFLGPISSISPSCLINSTGLYPVTDLQKPTSSNRDSYTVSYLINSCGLSPELAVSVSEKIKIRTPENPDKVLELLRTHGFTEPQISKLVKKRPLLLLADPEKTLLPKLEFFLSKGVSRTDLASTLSSNHELLTSSLEKRIIPSYNYLKSVLKSDKMVISAMKRALWVICQGHWKYIAPNIAVLRELQVPESKIAFLLTRYPGVVMQNPDQFRETVSEVKEMGFNPLKCAFVAAVHALSGKSNKSIWDRCYVLYTKWGWSEDEILLAFKKHPNCMLLSEKKIARAMEFFVNKMGLQSKDIARCPGLLLFSLEKRIIPRASIFLFLSSKGLVKKDFSLGTIFITADKYFLERFVIKYEVEVPQLLSVYHGRMDVREL